MTVDMWMYALRRASGCTGEQAYHTYPSAAQPHAEKENEKREISVSGGSTVDAPDSKRCNGRDKCTYKYIDS